MENMDKETLYKYNTFLTTKDGKEDREILWANFGAQLLEALKLKWPSDKNTGRAIGWKEEFDVPGGSNRQQFDLGCTIPSTNVCIAIEFEIRRPTGVRNINKAWMAADKTGQIFRMFQAFSPLFNGGHSHAVTFSQRLDEARFIGRKAQDDLCESFTYQCLPMKTWPLKDPTQIATVIQEIQTIIQPEDGL